MDCINRWLVKVSFFVFVCLYVCYEYLMNKDVHRSI